MADVLHGPVDWHHRRLAADPAAMPTEFVHRRSRAARAACCPLVPLRAIARRGPKNRTVKSGWYSRLKPDPLDLILGEPFLGAVVKLGRARAFVRGHLLRVL
jgi:hypothetical protein